MQDLISEILTMAFLAVSIFVFVFFKQKIKLKQQIQNFDENLKKFNDEFGVCGNNFDEVCKNLVKNNLAKEIDMNIKVSDFLQILGKDMFYDFEYPDEIINEKNILLCTNNLKDNLKMAIYELKKDKSLIFVFNEEKIFKLVDLAGNLGENIIICD